MSAVERYFTEVVPPCAACGNTGPVVIPPDNLPERLQSASEEAKAQYLLDEWEKLDEKLRDTLRRLSWLCPRCTLRSRQELVEMERAERAARAVREAYETDLMPRDAVAHVFQHSKPEYEERNPEVWAKARVWNPKDGGLWLTGDRGTGKTFLARCLLNASLDRGVLAMEATAIQFARWAERFDAVHHIRRAQQVPVLLLDDVDKAVWSNRSFELLWETMDLRQRKSRRTFITSNTTASKMREVWKALRPDNPSIVNAMFDRMRDFTTWELHGRSIRADEAASA